MNATNNMKVPKRIFLIHVEGLNHVECVEALRRRGIECVLITQRALDETKTFAEVAPDAIHVTLAEACFADPPKGMRSVPQPATERDLAAIAPVSSRILQCLEYSNFPARPSSDLYRLYVRLVGLWRTLLDELKPDAVVFNYDVSLRGFDYVLYELCRADNLPRLIFNHTLVQDRLMPLRDIYEPIGPTMEEILAAPSTQISDAVDSPGIEDQNKVANDPARFRKTLEWKSIARTLLGRRYFSRHAPVTWFLYNPTPRWAEVRYRRAKGKVLSRRCLRYYDKIAVAPDWHSDFVYFPLQVQPEESTGIQGEHFSDLWHVLSTTSAALPPGWRIYVKEHPNQFNRNFRMEKGRNLEFYRWIANIPNVTFVPMETDSRELVTRCRAVVTCAGSTGYEALKAGKPSIVFGFPWYLKAPGVVRVNGVEACRSALARVANGSFKISKDLVQRYENLMREKYTYQLILTHEFWTLLSKIDHKEHANTFAQAVVTELGKQGVEFAGEHAIAITQ